MKKLATVLSLLLALSVVLAAAAPLALADEVQPVIGDNSPERDAAVINWTPSSLVITVAPGETAHARAVFTSRINIARANLVVSFPLSRYVTIEPRQYTPVTPGPLYPVELTVTLPNQTDATDSHLPPVITGFIQVVGQGMFQNALPVTIVRANTPPPLQWTPPQVKMFVDIPEITPGPAPVTTTEVAFTSAVTITNARLRATPPLNRVLDLSETGPITLTPGVTYTLVLSAHMPVATTSADTDTALGEAERGTARRVVSGMVEVFTSSRVYAKSLPVTVVLSPLHVQPTITWRPPVVTMRVAVGQSATTVVTMTSNMTIENAHLEVTGAITPYLTALFAQTDPVTILPNRPYTVTLNVSSPTTAQANRPFLGEVVVTDSLGHALRQELKVVLLWYRPPATTTP
jgi:hypothetical protein